MLPKSDWAHLIPHAGGMCLLDAVLAWDENAIHACSEGHARADHPLRGPRGLHAVHLAEYGAQAMAVHGALVARAHGIGQPRPGLLVALREVAMETEYVSGNGRLDVHSHCMFADDGGAQYAFRVEQCGRLLASGRAAVIHPREVLP